MDSNIFDDYDEESRQELEGLQFLNLDTITQGLTGVDSFRDIRTDKILLGETIRGMTNVHPMLAQKFYNRPTKDISRFYFPDAEKEFFEAQGIDLHIDVDCETAAALFVDSSSFFYDTNGNTILDEGELLFHINLYASKNGIKLNEAFECSSPKDGEVLIFIEDNKDELSRQVVRIKMAANIRNAFKKHNVDYSAVLTYINKHTSGLTPVAFELLIKTGQIEEKFIVTDTLLTGVKYALLSVSAPLRAIGWIIEHIGKGIDFLKLPESVWDTQSENYIFNKEQVIDRLTINPNGFDLLEQTLINDKNKLQWNALVPDLALDKIRQVIDYLKAYIETYNAYITQKIEAWYATDLDLSILQEKIAFSAGLYNGFIDFIASTLQFLGQLAAAPFEVAYNWQEFLETVDNIIESIKNFNPSDVWNAMSSVYELIKSKLKDPNGDFDWVRIAYVIGFAIMFVGTMFVPIAGWVGKVAKLSKLIPEELLAVVQKAMSDIAVAGKNLKQSALRTIERLFEIFAKGKRAIVEFFKQAVDAIVAWFTKNSNRFKLVEKVEASLLSSVRILKDNRLYLNCLKLVTEPIKNGRHGRQLGRWIAVESEAMIKMYTGYTYALLNEALFNGKRLNRELKAMKEVLDDALARLPISSFNSKGLLLRSAYHSEAEIKKLFKIGKEWTSKGFFSTTHSEKSMLNWLRNKPKHNVIFKVRGKNGKLIEKAAYMWEEHEVLFISGTKFIVDRIGKIDHPLDFNRKIIEIILKEK